MIYKVLVSDKAFVPVAEIQHKISGLSWEYTRIGGCGAFKFNVAQKFCREVDLGINFNIKIYVKDLTTNSYDLWYQGRIENKNHNIRNHDESISVSGLGYQSELSDIYVDRDYTSDEVSVVVKSILDNDIVPNTNITYSGGDITATSFTPDSLEFNTKASNCMRTLSELIGSREWGVDKDRKFFFKERSDAVGFIYPFGKKILSFSGDNTSKEIVNRAIVIGGDVSGSPYTKTVNDLNSQLKFNRRDATIQNSAIVTDAVADQFATALFSEFGDVVRRARVTVLDTQRFEVTTPMGTLQIRPRLFTYNERQYRKFLYSGLISYQINRIRYKINPQGVLQCDLSLGQLRPDIAETIGQLEYKIDQLANQGV